MAKVQLIALLLQVVIEISLAGEQFNRHGSNYYISYPLKKDWHQSQRFCTANGMYLLDIRTEAEEKRVNSILTEYHKQINADNEHLITYWTSGTNYGSDNEYYWVTTGQPMLFSRLSITSTDKDKCVRIGSQKNDTIRWSSDSCALQGYFVCRDTYDVPVFKSPACSILSGKQ